MFYTLILENETSQQIDLSKTDNRFMFSNIEGLNPPAEIFNNIYIYYTTTTTLCQANFVKKPRKSIFANNSDNTIGIDKAVKHNI